MSQPSSVSTAGGLAGIAITARQRRIVRAFENRQAVSPMSARTLADLDVSESRHVRRLTEAGVLSVTSEGRYFLNTDRWNEVREARRLRILIMLAAFGLLLLVYLLFQRP